MVSRKGFASALVFGLSLLALAPVAYSDHCGDLTSARACNGARPLGGHFCEWKPEEPVKCHPIEGMTAKEIIALQKELIAKEGAKLRVNGKYDDATERAVKAFQRKYGIHASGKPNQATKDKLFKW